MSSVAVAVACEPELEAPGLTEEPPSNPLCGLAPAELAPLPGVAAPSNRGPGGPRAAFAAAELGTVCAYLDGGPGDELDHHNLLTMYDGYLVMPWAPESGGGGISVWDVAEPCHPIQIGYGYSEVMRETHTIGFSSLGGRWAVTNYMAAETVGGIMFWDLSDLTAPRPVSEVALSGFRYPDAYARVTFSSFWQAPFVYVAAGDNGIYVVNATDPRDPFVAGHYGFEPVLRAGQVHAVGNLLSVIEAEGTRAVLIDISDPTQPRPIPGGDFIIRDAQGVPREVYSGNLAGGYVYFTRKDSGGGLIVYDISDPTRPTFAGDYVAEGNGGYVFVKDEHAFAGESSYGAAYHIADPTRITEVMRFQLRGDLDTVSPIGNVVVLSVDDDAQADRGSAIVPFAGPPDTRAPRVTWAWPSDGAARLRRSSRFGIMFSEAVDPGSAWAGSVRLYRTADGPDAGRVAGVVSVQENVVSFVPHCELEPNEEYTLHLPAGGIADFNGNPLAEAMTLTVRTGSL